MAAHPHYPRVSADPEAQARYEAMRRAGESHTIAEVLATRSFPAVSTDAVFMQGRYAGNQFDDLPEVGAAYRAEAEAAGVNPAGKWYCGALAETPGDPRAWIDSRADVGRIARERGWKVDGAVTLDARPDFDAGPSASYRVADELVAAEVDALIAEQPELAPRREGLLEECRASREGGIGGEA